MIERVIDVAVAVTLATALWWLDVVVLGFDPTLSAMQITIVILLVWRRV